MSKTNESDVVATLVGKLEIVLQSVADRVQSLISQSVAISDRRAKTKQIRESSFEAIALCLSKNAHRLIQGSIQVHFDCGNRDAEIYWLDEHGRWSLEIGHKKEFLFDYQAYKSNPALYPMKLPDWLVTKAVEVITSAGYSEIEGLTVNIGREEKWVKEEEGKLQTLQELIESVYSTLQSAKEQTEEK